MGENIETKHIVRSFDEDLRALTQLIAEMGGLAERQTALAVQVLEGRDVALAAAEAAALDREVDALEEEIDQSAIRLLATRQPMAKDLRFVAMCLKISNNLERASDHAASTAKKAARFQNDADAALLRSLARIGEGVQHMLRDVLDAFVGRDGDKAREVWRRDAEIDRAYDAVLPDLLRAVAEAPVASNHLSDLLFVAKNLERIGDHATNIAEKIAYIVDGDAINLQRK